MRNEITLPRLAAVAGFAFSCFVLLIYLWLASGGSVPMQPQKYQVHVLLPQAKGLGQHSDVRVSGVTVGHVVYVKPAKPTRLGRADVLIDLDAKYMPLREDARAMLRGKSIIGEAYVALSLGTRDSPPIADGGTLAMERAVETVESDQVFGTYDEATRAAFREWMQTQGPGLAAHGYELNAAVSSLRPWMVDAERLLSIVEQQSGDVSALLRDGGTIAEGLGERETAIQLLARSGDRAFNAVGRQGDSLAAAFRELPEFQRQARGALDALTGFAERGTDDVAELRRNVEPLSPALVELAADAPALRTIVEAMPPLERAGGDGLPALTEVLDAAPPMLRELDPFLQSLNPALRYLASGRTELMSLVANLAAGSQSATSTPNSQEPVHYVRAMPTLNPAVLGPLSRRPGVNRSNAYPVPELLDLASGYLSYETRGCGNATPYITPEPSPHIDEAQRDQIRLYAFGGSPANPPRPDCDAQGTAFPQLSRDR